MKALVLSMVLFIIVSCENPVDTLESQIFGTITDGNTGHPIAGAYITLRYMSDNGIKICQDVSHTNENGKYVLTGVIYTSWDYYLEASKDGYENEDFIVQRKASQHIDILMSTKRN